MLLRERSERENFYISPGPFIGPVEIRGKKNKKKYFFSPSCLEVRELTISLLCTKNLSYYHRRIQTIKRKKTIKKEQVMIMMTFERVILIFY